MTSSSRLLTALTAAALVLAACTGVQDTEAPVVEITSPAEQSEFTVAETVIISGSSDDNRQVREVRISIGGEHHTTVVPAENGDWQASWQPDAVGEHTITAVAVDLAHNESQPDSVTILIVPDPTVPGSVSGTLRRAVPDAPTTTEALSRSGRADIVPGQLFIVFEHGRPDLQLGTASAGLSTAAAEGFSFRADGSFSYQGEEFTRLRNYPTASGLALYSFAEADEQATWELAAELEGRSTIREVIPNLMVESQALPDDPLFGIQAWHLTQLNLPAAWDIETGDSSEVYVAVLDSGSYPHSDINWAEVGANFVNWDPEDGPQEGSIEDHQTLSGGSSHGTHVAGTIGAVTNNGEGVAGVNWHLRPIPVKVLGAAGSGSFAGLFEGLIWAAGLDMPEYGGHVNPNPARVANLSLGGLWGDVCPAAFDELFEAIYQLTGLITVVAAGNEGSPGNPFVPAACDSVITVGATGPTGARAYYSNYGTKVDVFAPGGDADYLHPVPELAEQGVFAGVLSTDWVTGPADAEDFDTETFGFAQGTSMAAPHVSGVVSLMLAAEPSLNREQVRERLHAASYPLSIEECGFVAPGLGGLNQCGAGLLDAEAALLGIEVLATTATVWAVPFSGEEAPVIDYSDLGSLDLMTGYKAEGAAQADGSFEFEFTALPPGGYVMVGIEQRRADAGIGTTDRLATEVITLEADGAVDLELETTPIYLTVR